jgi:hypothetical protein
MKVLFVGQLGRGQTSDMRADSLERLGHEVVRVDSSDVWRQTHFARRRLERTFEMGPSIRQLNLRVVGAAQERHADLLWAEKQRFLNEHTLHRLQQLGVTRLHYDPDPYFALEWKRTRLANRCLPLYDVLAVTKRYELADYESAASGIVVYSPLGFDTVRHSPVGAESSSEVWQSDVAFVGGWEPRRERLLLAARSVGLQVRIWGYGWRLALQNRWNPSRAWRLRKLDPGSGLYLGEPPRELEGSIASGEAWHGEIYEERYAAAVAGAKICPGFLRQVCPDQHTTRTFEIPAMGGFLLADRTEEHLSFFEEGVEAEFFSTDDEFIDKARYYSEHEQERRKIADAGRQRCLNSGYSYDDRVREILNHAGLG